MRIEFTIKGTPKGQPRPRAWARKMGDGKVVARMYEAGSAEAWKSCIAFEADQHKPAAPLDGPIRVDVTFLFARPKRLLRKCDSSDCIPHTEKPDRDNLDKCVLDVLKTLGFFHDDCQVCAGDVSKFYVNKGGVPGATVVIETLDINPEPPPAGVREKLFAT